MQFEQNCANEVFQQSFIVVIPYWISTFYVKHKTFFAHYVYSRVDLCSCVCWSWYFSPDESHSRPSTISSILSVFDRKFRSSLKPLSLSSPKSAAIKTVRFWWVIFSKHDANSSIRWLSSTPTAFASYKVLINISWNETFYFWVALEIVNLCFFAVSIAYFRFHIVQVSQFMAGSCYPSWFATESALYCVLDKCLVRWNGTSSFQNTVRVETSLQFFSRWMWVLPKTQLYRMSSSCMPRAIRSV